MSTQVKSTQALQGFIYKFKLRDNHSNIFFDALIEIKTAYNEKVLEDRIQITFDGYSNAGTLTILGEKTEVNLELFPVKFEANWQVFEFVKNNHLKITGTHNQNPKIGKYTVLITPLISTL